MPISNSLPCLADQALSDAMWCANWRAEAIVFASPAAVQTSQAICSHSAMLVRFTACRPIFATAGRLIGLLKVLTAATARLVDRNDGRIDSLLRRMQDLKAELLNRRLGLLTIVSAIFMPLTLLAGIWGMNFENMPELSYPYAYWVALALMGTLAATGAWLFYRGGWFD